MKLAAKIFLASLLSVYCSFTSLGQGKDLGLLLDTESQTGTDYSKVKHNVYILKIYQVYEDGKQDKVTYYKAQYTSEEAKKWLEKLKESLRQKHQKPGVKISVDFSSISSGKCGYVYTRTNSDYYTLWLCQTDCKKSIADNINLSKESPQFKEDVLEIICN